jgi:hypothetical protein
VLVLPQLLVLKLPWLLLPWWGPPLPLQVPLQVLL